MADILLKPFKYSSFAQEICLECIISYSPDELVFDVYVQEVILT